MYKRQALTTVLFTTLFTIAMSLNSSYETFTFRQIGGYAHGSFKDVDDSQIKEIASHDKVKAVGAVSYTHLDVYKRQDTDSSRKLY